MTPEQIEQNEAILYGLALKKDQPSKVWARANFADPRIAKALGVDMADPAALYALAPFGMATIDGRARILAAWPCPAFLGDGDIDWLGVEHVMAWNPDSNQVDLLGEAKPTAKISGHLIGAFDGTEKGTIYANPFAFFRNWVEHRAQFVTRYATLKQAHWSTPPIERDYPGVLMVGSADQIAWRAGELPKFIDCVGLDADALNKALIKAASLPWVSSASKMKMVA